MTKYFILLLLLLNFTGISQNTITETIVRTTTGNDSIFICPFPTNCGYYKGDIIIVNGKSEANGKGKANLKLGNAVGQWANNQLNGQGTYKSKEGSQASGEWKDGLLNGDGTKIYKDKTKYIGKFKNNKFDGKGSITLNNSDRYTGEWKGDQMDGYGIYSFANGNKYTGEW